MNIEPGVYWYRGPLFRNGKAMDRTGWEVVEVEDIGNGELILGMLGEVGFCKSVDVASMARVGKFVLIDPPVGGVRI